MAPAGPPSNENPLVAQYLRLKDSCEASVGVAADYRQDGNLATRH